MNAPALRPSAAVRETLRGVAHDVIAEARTAIRIRQVEANAVHDFRKAMKRWRAFLRLLRPYLGDEGRRMPTRRASSRAPCRRARRPVGARCARRSDKGEQALSPRSIRHHHRRLEEIRAVGGEDAHCRNARALHRRARPAADVGRVLAASAADLRGRRRPNSPTSIGAPARRSGAIGRRPTPRRCTICASAWSSTATRWRSSSRCGRASVKFWVGEAQRLRERLGHHQDMLVLASLTVPHGPLAPWRSRLTR